MTRYLLALGALAGCTGGSGDDDHDTDGPSLPEDTFVHETDPGETDDRGPVLPGGNNGGGDPPPSCTEPDEPGLDGVCDFSVHEAEVYVAPTASKPLVLEVRASGANPAGGFHGVGVGNRAIAGFHGYNRKPLSDIDEIRFVSRAVSGEMPLELAVQIDLDCGKGRFALLEVRAANFDTVLAKEGGWSEYVAPASQTIWTAARDVTDPVDPSAVLLHASTDILGTPRTLGPLLDAYPDACLRNVDGGFADLPKGRGVSSVILTLGSRTVYSTGSVWEVSRVQIGADVHTSD